MVCYFVFVLYMLEIIDFNLYYYWRSEKIDYVIFKEKCMSCLKVILNLGSFVNIIILENCIEE